jgi:hypothetical protein
MPEIPAKILLGVLRKKSLSEDMVLTDGGGRIMVAASASTEARTDRCDH